LIFIYISMTSIYYGAQFWIFRRPIFYTNVFGDQNVQHSIEMIRTKIGNLWTKFTKLTARWLRNQSSSSRSFIRKNLNLINGKTKNSLKRWMTWKKANASFFSLRNSFFFHNNYCKNRVKFITLILLEFVLRNVPYFVIKDENRQLKYKIEKVFKWFALIWHS